VHKNSSGKVLKKQKLVRRKVAEYFANTPEATVIMEACGSTHYWSRVIMKCGHEVKAIAPQYVVAYRKGNKNDFNDADAMVEAAQREGMRFVPIKSIEQQDIQLVHRIRERLVGNRTALSNQVRGLLAEYGIVIAKGIAHVKAQLPLIVEDADNELSIQARRHFDDLYNELDELNSRIKEVDKDILALSRQHPVCQRLSTMTGIGPLISTALYAGIGQGNTFENGRHLAAWLGLVPRQHSTGDNPRLFGISKRGNTYLRTQLINGARAALNQVENKSDKVSVWAKQLKGRSSFNNACVALANKMARMAWAMLHHQQDYQLKTLAN
jgi:transposase